jgi:ornithine carbamoyltransferase
MRNILSDWDLSKKDLVEILNISEEIKSNRGEYSSALYGKVLTMLFELPSLRTRISFEAGMAQMGGHAVFFGVEEGGFSRSETLEDGVKVLSRYSDCIMARVLDQKAMERMGDIVTVPLINGMTNKYHPCQNLADLLTIKENKGELEDLKIAYVGDGACNTATSTMIGCSQVDMDVNIVCPDVREYSPDQGLIKKIKGVTGKEVKVFHEAEAGVENVDVIYTDTWVSAGMEAEKEKRLTAFLPYQVDVQMVEKASPDCIVMHCMPAHREYEITSEVMDSEQSVIIDQAENRMHAQKGLLYLLLKE